MRNKGIILIVQDITVASQHSASYTLRKCILEQNKVSNLFSVEKIMKKKNCMYVMCILLNVLLCEGGEI